MDAPMRGTPKNLLKEGPANLPPHHAFARSGWWVDFCSFSFTQICKVSENLFSCHILIFPFFPSGFFFLSLFPCPSCACSLLNSSSQFILGEARCPGVLFQPSLKSSWTLLPGQIKRCQRSSRLYGGSSFRSSFSLPTGLTPDPGASSLPGRSSNESSDVCFEDNNFSFFYYKNQV